MHPVVELHVSVVHGSRSSHEIGVCLTPPLALHESCVQASLSLVLIGVWLTPVDGLHKSVVQASKSSTETTVCEQVPPKQSSVVQRSESSQSESNVQPP